MNLNNYIREVEEEYKKRFIVDDNYQLGVSRIAEHITPEDMFNFLTDKVKEPYEYGYKKGRQDTLKEVREKIKTKKVEPNEYWNEEYREGWRNVCDDILKELEALDE